MKIRKNVCLSILAVLMAVLICACSFHTYMSFTFNVETGDSVKVQLDTSNDLSLSQEDGCFYVSKYGEEIMLGMFITEDTYNQYISLENSDKINVFDKGTEDNKDYLFYECEGESGTEYDFLVWLKNSNTGVLMGSTTGESAAKEVFDALSFSIE